MPSQQGTQQGNTSMNDPSVQAKIQDLQNQRRPVGPGQNPGGPGGVMTPAPAPAPAGTGVMNLAQPAYNPGNPTPLQTGGGGGTNPTLAPAQVTGGTPLKPSPFGGGTMMPAPALGGATYANAGAAAQADAEKKQNEPQKNAWGNFGGGNVI